ncbi:hypothetical protein N7539_005540 [Penicillium diatomitis]|uniref:Chromo domain-containing protein n=1 Tax=Penicillium diatomitis TaxID=2819901 RepID=A0A9X0BV27_9EURO|nr:uncharacterized protein N7539_005540 [Penicillium diatomitis]KAJ5485552.1 hypothetical protein N7539_005540 [Penicillium diatomitis]
MPSLRWRVAAKRVRIEYPSDLTIIGMDGGLRIGLPTPDLEDEEWEVEVNDEKTIRKVQYYRVKWKDWPSDDNEQISEGDMTNARQAIQKFEKTQKGQRPQ